MAPSTQFHGEFRVSYWVEISDNQSSTKRCEQIAVSAETDICVEHRAARNVRVMKGPLTYWSQRPYSA